MRSHFLFHVAHITRWAAAGPASFSAVSSRSSPEGSALGAFQLQLQLQLQSSSYFRRLLHPFSPQIAEDRRVGVATPKLSRFLPV